ncbi:MAG: class I tRNA ligase family protein, partial [Candidatus Omnitrophica bacterium]|nr:class I tRNA ligase family protein [Candidatus Omnitrophota bacterium]
MEYKNTLNLPKTDFPMKANLPNREPGFLKRWEDNKLHEKIRAKYKDKPRFILHDGPPYANGSIHMGHALNKILKDIVIRYKTMRGFDSPYVPGWDCHGLPVE